jgi:hypothetical protein
LHRKYNREITVAPLHDLIDSSVYGGYEDAAQHALNGNAPFIRNEQKNGFTRYFEAVLYRISLF